MSEQNTNPTADEGKAWANANSGGQNPNHFIPEPHQNLAESWCDDIR
jgi:hypothetical protein